MFAPWKESYDKSRQRIKKQRHHFDDKRLSSQSHDFSSSHVQMWELDHRESREFQKHSDFSLIDYTKAFDYVNHDKLENS